MTVQVPDRPAFDTVIVPDFSGSRSAQFEARSLLFLASWLEHAGQARSFPLHLACIGEPPSTVQLLAEQCGAIVSLHRPLDLESSGVANKLRAFEAPLQTEHLLLLDVDTIILGDLSSLANLGDCLAAAPAIAYRVRERAWQRIYPALNLEIPSQWWTACLLDETKYHLPGRRHRPGEPCACRPMRPYYNSGVLWVPRQWGLEQLWASDITRIAALFDPGDPDWHVLGECDQAGLATAIVRLRQQGCPFRRLPDAWHTNQVHLFRRRLRSPHRRLQSLPRLRPVHRQLPLLNRPVRIYHAIQLFAGLGAPLTLQEMQAGLEAYQAKLVAGLLESWKEDHPSGDFTELLEPLADIAWLYAELRRLVKRHVALVLQQR